MEPRRAPNRLLADRRRRRGAFSPGGSDRRSVSRHQVDPLPEGRHHQPEVPDRRRRRGSRSRRCVRRRAHRSRWRRPMARSSRRSAGRLRRTDGMDARRAPADPAGQPAAGHGDGARRRSRRLERPRGVRGSGRRVGGDLRRRGLARRGWPAVHVDERAWRMAAGLDRRSRRWRAGLPHPAIRGRDLGAEDRSGR